jgi:dTDP-4-amino-4,6-dideoxygalactose transaminase
MSELKSSGIQASKVHLRNDIYGCFGTGAADLPGVREFSARTLSIPCGWWVTPEDAERIVQTIMAKI